MSFCLALLLFGADDLPVSLSDPEPEQRPAGTSQVFVRLRGGLWYSRQLNFDAVSASGQELHSKQEVLGAADLDVGYSVELGAQDQSHYDFVVFGSIEGAFGDEIRIVDASLCLGFRGRAEPGTSPWIPQEFILYFGPSYGVLDVTASGFVEFKGGSGSRSGFSLAWRASRAFSIDFMVEYRYLRFEVKDKDQIASGDTRMGAGGVWMGLAADLRF